jgi:hypothetical protein
MDKKAVSLYKNISILILTIMSPCLLVDEITASLGNPFVFRSAIMLNLLILALLSLRSSKIWDFSRDQKRILIYFMLAIGYYLVIGVTVYPGTGYTTKTPIKNFIMGILVFIIINNQGFSLKRLTNIFVNMAFLLSLLAVVQYIMYYIDIIELKKYVLKTYSPGDYRYIGFGGFIDPDYMRWNIYRIESFWREPSRFAQYLQIPLFIAIYRYSKQKILKNLVVIIVIGSAFVLTYSAANYFSFIIAFIVYFSIVRKDSLSNIRLLKRTISYGFVSILIYLLVAFFIYTNQYSENSSNKVLEKRTTRQFANRIERFVFASSVLEVSIFGDPTIRNNWRRNPSAIGMLFIWGGIPGVLLSLGYSVRFYALVIRAVRKSSYGIIYVGSLAFFIAFNWYGSYFDTYFIFIIAFLSSYSRNESRYLTSERLA